MFVAVCDVVLCRNTGLSKLPGKRMEVMLRASSSLMLKRARVYLRRVALHDQEVALAITTRCSASASLTRGNADGMCCVDFGGGDDEGESEQMRMEKRKRKQEHEEERDRLWQIKLAEGMKESLRLQQEYEKAQSKPSAPSAAGRIPKKTISTGKESAL